MKIVYHMLLIPGLLMVTTAEEQKELMRGMLDAVDLINHDCAEQTNPRCDRIAAKVQTRPLHEAPPLLHELNDQCETKVDKVTNRLLLQVLKGSDYDTMSKWLQAAIKRLAYNPQFRTIGDRGKVIEDVLEAASPFLNWYSIGEFTKVETVCAIALVFQGAMQEALEDNSSSTTSSGVPSNQVSTWTWREFFGSLFSFVEEIARAAIYSTVAASMLVMLA